MFKALQTLAAFNDAFVLVLEDHSQYEASEVKVYLYEGPLVENAEKIFHQVSEKIQAFQPSMKNDKYASTIPLHMLLDHIAPVLVQSDFDTTIRISIFGEAIDSHSLDIKIAVTTTMIKSVKELHEFIEKLKPVN